MSLYRVSDNGRLSYSGPASTRTSRDSFRTQGNNKRDYSIRLHSSDVSRILVTVLPYEIW